MPKAKKQRRTKSQEEKVEDTISNHHHELHVEFGNLLRTITTRTSLWKEAGLRYLRNFCHTVANNPDIFPALMGDLSNELDPEAVEEAHELVMLPTVGYIETVAEGGDSSELTSTPILSVLTRTTGYHDVLQHEDAKSHQKVKLTHLTLVDGDNNQIHARLVTHLADAGRHLGEGDIIKLDLFTELAYRVNDGSPSMPALFISRFTRVGHAPMPVKNDLNAMIPYTCSQSTQNHTGHRKSPYPILDPLKQSAPDCNFENRLCNKFGVNFIGCCICKQIPVADRDLEIIPEDCHLINRPYSELKENKPKRLMLYWWYATNIYSLTGKGNRGKLPDCLEYAIKAAYPETDSANWTGFIGAPSSLKHKKN